MKERSAEEYLKLSSAEFNAIIAADPEIKRLQSLKYDKVLERRVLLEVMGLGDYRIGSLPVRPLTAAKWAFLWMLDSPFVSDGEITVADLDVALYVFSVPSIREINIAPHAIPGEASGLHLATGLEIPEIAAEIRTVIRIAFLPLEMLPETGVKNDPVQFDAAWLSNIAGLAARESGVPFDSCMHELSLSCVCSLFIAWKRREGVDGDQIRHRLPSEIAGLVEKRMDELEDQYLKSKNIF